MERNIQMQGNVVDYQLKIIKHLYSATAWYRPRFIAATIAYLANSGK
jgi:hypothetical protein